MNRIVLQFVILLALGICIFGTVPAQSQDCEPIVLPHYEDFDNLQWTWVTEHTPMVQQNCWRANQDDHFGGIVMFPPYSYFDHASAGVGSQYVTHPSWNGPFTRGCVTLLVAPEFDSPPLSVSFSIYSYGIYDPAFAGDSVRKRLAVGYIADTNDWKGSFVGVDTIELTRERVVWERFTVTGFEDMPAPYFVAFFNDTLLQYPPYAIVNNHQVMSFYYYVDSILFTRNPNIPDPNPDDTTAQGGNSDTSSFPSEETEPAVTLWMPNAFTPGKNGRNDVFLPVFNHPEMVEKYQLVIYNRWGNLIFRTEEITQGWNGDGLPEGVYLCTVRYKPKGGKEKEEKGVVTLVR